MIAEPKLTVAEARKAIRGALEMAVWDGQHIKELTVTTIRNMAQAVDAFEDAVRAEAYGQGVQDGRELEYDDTSD